ncbi:hypothetical protein [Rhizobium sp. 9140]|uniref:hypothetical protein n=1 Tax=Rhizobium sp. 9140 TaxID=1761900 RepID=UPI0007996A88|nr:hypothetical protein [Rhizobium sp. 9140]CZT34947.1 hypothetical protein GA0004734_00019590 [Rhizobium sp. 9140]
MFLRIVDWPKAVAMVGDIAKGTASVTLRTYSRKNPKASGAIDIYGWSFQQVQAYGQSETRPTRLVGADQLSGALLGVATPDDTFFAYEVDGGVDYDADAKCLVKEFNDIAATVVSVTVGAVSISWFLVVLHQNSDIIHWKMRYHERDQRPDISEL